MRTLLALGIDQDPHVSRVIKEVRELGGQVVLLDYQRPDVVSFHFNDAHEPTISVNGEAIRGPIIVWDRVKLRKNPDFYFKDVVPDESEHDRDRRYALQEQLWRVMYRTIVYDDRHEHLSDQLIATKLSFKTLQHELAAGLGFRVPASIITSSKSDALRFVDAHSKVIAKGLAPASVLRPDHPTSHEPLMTMEILRSEIEEAGVDGRLEGPILFQQQVDKEYELRVFAVGSDVYAYRVESQTYELTKVDWRYGNAYIPFYETDLDPEIARVVTKFLKHTKQAYGSFDFIVDKRGQHWFLECNPDGQWGFLETAEEQKLSRRLGRYIHERLTK